MLMAREMEEVVEIRVKVPAGYRVSDFRIPYPGDLYLVDGHVRERKSDTSIGFPCVIVEKDWAWPDWLLCQWIAMDKDGMWWAYGKMPVRKEGYWYLASEGGEEVPLSTGVFAFAAPKCSDWTTSLRKNPWLSDVE